MTWSRCRAPRAWTCCAPGRGRYAVDGDGGLAAANEMVRLLGGLPLALFLAGRYLAQRRQQAREFVEWLEQTGLDALHFADRPSKSIPLLMARSLEHVSEAAQAAFDVVGVLALAPFEAEVMAVGLQITDGGGAPGPGRAGGLRAGAAAGRRLPGDARAGARLCRGRMPGRTRPRRSCGWRSTTRRWHRSRAATAPPGFAVLDRHRSHIVAVQAAALKAEQWEAVRRITWKVKDYLDLKGYVFQPPDRRPGRPRRCPHVRRPLRRGPVLKRAGAGALLAGRAPARRGPVHRGAGHRPRDRRPRGRGQCAGQPGPGLRHPGRHAACHRLV